MAEQNGQWWQRDEWRLGVALAVALGLHAALLLTLRSERASEPPPAAAPSRALEITLNRAPAAAPAPVPAAPPAPVATARAPETATRPVAAATPLAAPDAPAIAAAEPAAPAAPSAASELPRPVAATELRQPPTSERASSGSFLDRVVGVGGAGPPPAVAALDRALDQPAPYDWLFARPAPVDREAASRSDVMAGLTPNTLGGYSFQGTRIAAMIFEDGSVVLYDPHLVRAEVLGVPVERLPLLFKDPQAEIRRTIKLRRKMLEQWGQALGLPLGEDALNALAALHLLMTANSISGVYDLTEIAIRAVGDDPYASEKQCFLTATEPLREKMKMQSLAQRDQRALDELHAHLCEVWGNSERPAVERRATLFELWDECAESESGESARAIIVEFIRDRLAEGSSDAYSAVELLALNARRTSARLFSPYQ